MRNLWRRFHCQLLVQFGVFRYAFLHIKIARPNLNQIGMCLHLIFLLFDQTSAKLHVGPRTVRPGWP
jgi:hypothetical protein